MSTLPRIYAIQASDAPKHSETLRKILLELESEKRISGYTELSPDTDLSSVSDDLQSEDLVLVLLTKDFEANKSKIENQLKTINSGQPGVKIAEILIDNVVYDNEFITFPADLRPIRDREDMDGVWREIGKSLKNMLPIQQSDEETKEPVSGNDWGKYLKIVGVVVGLLLIFFVIRGMWNGNGETPVPAEPVPVEENGAIDQPAPEDPDDQEEEAAAVLQGEDCLSFNHQNLEVRVDGNRFLVTDGRSRMMLFDTNEKAREAVSIMQHYQADNRCFAIRPNPALSYLKTGRDIPSGSFNGEDCIRIRNPQNLTIRETSSDLFQVLDGNNIPYAARSREEAERVIEIVQHYNAGFTCYVERPDPGMVYLRK